MDYKIFTDEQLEALMTHSVEILNIISDAYDEGDKFSRFESDEYCANSVVSINAFFELRSRKVAALVDKGK